MKKTISKISAFAIVAIFTLAFAISGTHNVKAQTECPKDGVCKCWEPTPYETECAVSGWENCQFSCSDGDCRANECKTLF